MPASEQRRAREAAALAEYVARVVAEAPTLTDRQVTRLATLLNPTHHPVDHARSRSRGAA